MTMRTILALTLAVTLTGGLAEEAGKLIGIGDTGVQVWDIAKWPVVVIIAVSEALEVNEAG